MIGKGEMKINKFVKNGIAITGTFCILLQSGQTVLAKENLQHQSLITAVTEKGNPVTDLNKENVKSFADDYFKKNSAVWHVPGVAVSVVKDGKELYKAGYGVSDIEKNTRVDPDVTTFPAASVSKLFTATAIMQLSQSGQLNLNEDIQKYADDISVRNSYKEKITCQNLLTHTSGLDEESELDGSVCNPGEIQSQKYYFQKHIPTVVVRPGTVCQYSNMGYNLLGYVVEKVSGETYENYVTSHILKPLQMNQTSIRIGNLNMADGYEYDKGQYQKVPFAYQYTSGSSGVIAPVTDMERFMIMHLNRGSCGNVSVLNPETEECMQKKQFSNSAVLDGMGEGFIREDWNGVGVLRHEGALPGYTTTLLMIPEENFGIYVATNSLGGMVFDFEEAFLEHFYGTCHITGNGQTKGYDQNRYCGTYRSYDGVSTRNISRIFAVLDSTAELEVKKSKGSELVVTYYEQSKEKVKTNLIYQTGDTFIREDGKGYVTFRRNAKGQIVYAFNHISHQAYGKISRMETTGVMGAALLLLLVLLLGSALVMLIRCKTQKRSGCRRFMVINSLINLSYVISFTGIFMLETYMVLQYDYRFTGLIYFLLTVLLVTIGVNVLELFIRGCHNKNIENRKLQKIVKYGFMSIIQLCFVVMLYYFNMIGYHVF